MDRIKASHSERDDAGLTCLKGLTHSMVSRAKGSRHTCATTPEPVGDTVYLGSRSVSYTVPGSRGEHYTVTVMGTDGAGVSKPVESLEDMQISCECPDAERQHARSVGGRTSVCKHAAAVLTLLVDPEGDAVQAQIAAQRATRLAALPQDEKARLEYVLDSLSDRQVVDRLKTYMLQSPEAMGAVGAIFPADKYKGARAMECTRCGEEYDDNYPTVCRQAHPEDSVSIRTQNSKGTTFCCGVCGAKWYESQIYRYEEDDMDPEERPGYICWEGKHTQEPQEETGSEDEG
ncbi:hypothetical protein KIPB_004249 [Kipferlia bialata]|uniref:SWIM-type domain-containing protein n=1 Tax=Kipferlia bialata TaxID=797122 RepID=A0A9K3GHM7_9EUKA|nr:hypothetical protein KIPB_004249 [Kipferlia bialata]|eukprot:g4249.t1